MSRKLSSTNTENLQKLKECGLSYAIALLDGRWKVNILWAMHNGVNRYSALKKTIPGISEKMLTQRLKELEMIGIVNREQKNVVPPHVEYSFTEAGLSLIPVLFILNDWGNDVRDKTKLHIK